MQMQSVVINTLQQFTLIVILIGLKLNNFYYSKSGGDKHESIESDSEIFSKT